jgi:transposase
MKCTWIGIDVAKTNFVVVALVAGEAVEWGEYTNDATGFSALRQQIEQFVRPAVPTEVHLVLEPTGGYELLLVAFAHVQGWSLSLPNPKQVRQWAQGTGRRAKTDRQDAKLLAHYGAANQPSPQPPLATEVSELDSLLKRRQELEQMLQQERNRQAQLTPRPGLSPAVLTNLRRVIEALEEALTEVNQAIQELLRQQPAMQREVERLLALPGIGPKNVLPLLVLLYRWQTLTAGEGTAKGITAYVGLDPQPYESGRSVRKRSAISKMGDAEIRRLLYMGALSAVRGRNPLRPFYQRLVGRGKVKKAAIVAAARKLLTWAWSIFSTKTDWNPQLHEIAS